MSTPSDPATLHQRASAQLHLRRRTLAALVDADAKILGVAACRPGLMPASPSSENPLSDQPSFATDLSESALADVLPESSLRPLSDRHTHCSVCATSLPLTDAEPGCVPVNRLFCRPCFTHGAPILYCSRACQRADWPAHRSDCCKGHGLPPTANTEVSLGEMATHDSGPEQLKDATTVVDDNHADLLESRENGEDYAESYASAFGPGSTVTERDSNTCNLSITAMLLKPSMCYSGECLPPMLHPLDLIDVTDPNSALPPARCLDTAVSPSLAPDLARYPPDPDGSTGPDRSSYGLKGGSGSAAPPNPPPSDSQPATSTAPGT